MSTDDATGAFRAAMSDAAPEPAGLDQGGTDQSHDTGQDGGDPSEQLRQAVEPQTRTAGDPDPSVVPEWRRREIEQQRAQERQEREAERRELAELRAAMEERKKAERPPADMFADPDDWQNRLREEMRGEWQGELQKLREERQQGWARAINANLEDALAEKGDAFQKSAERFMAAFNQDPQLQEQWRQLHPSRAVRFIEQWDKRNTLMSEIGTDPAAYEKRLREKILAEIQGGQEAAGEDAAPPRAAPRLVTEGPQPAARPKTIPSLNRATGAQDGDEPDDPVDAFRQAARPRR